LPARASVPAVKASARLVAEADGRGGTRLAVLRGESPLLLRRTGHSTGPGVTVHLVGGAAGPLRGDDLRLDIEVGPGAELDVHSVAASLALPGRPGAPPSRLEVHAAVAAGASLRWLPEPLIAAAGCDHRTGTHVEVADGGRLLWRDDLVCGRHGEPSGDVRTRTTIRYAGATLYRHDLEVGPGAPGWSGAAVLGATPAAGNVSPAGLVGGGALAGAPAGLARGAASGGTPAGLAGGAGGTPSGATGGAAPSGMPAGFAGGAGGTPSGATGGAAPSGMPAGFAGGGRATGSVIFAGPDLPPAGRVGANAAIMTLAGPGALAVAVGADIREVRAALDPLCAARAAAPA
jgi:urease accessory protein